MRGSMIGVAAMALVLTACEAPVDMVAVADKAVTEFHQRLDDDKVAAIKADADPTQLVASDRAAAMFNAQRIRLGKTVSSKRTAIKDDYVAKGRMLTMTYDTVFANGKATEVFIYHITGGKAVLFSYEATATDDAVTEFHKRLNAEDYDAILATAGSSLKGSEAKLKAILTALRTKAGSVKSTRNTSFNAYMTGDVRTVGLFYETVFTNVTESEEFLFHIKPDGTVELDGYFIKPVGAK